MTGNGPVCCGLPWAVLAPNMPTSFLPMPGSSSVPSLAILTSLFVFHGFLSPRVRKKGSLSVDIHVILKGLPKAVEEEDGGGVEGDFASVSPASSPDTSPESGCEELKPAC